SDAEIKKAFRELALKLHPDKNKAPDAHNKFVEINEAFQILSHAERRKQYDAVLEHHASKDKTKYTQADNNINVWAQEGRQKAKSYSDMGFNDFASDVLDYALSDTIYNAIADGISAAVNLASDVFDGASDVDWDD
ncbi:MAG TPA: DnaJ domain-containing protein, partial [Cyclobacteriaceae bacterium]